MRYTYAVIDLDNVYAWDTVNPNEGDVPFLSQPVHPDGRNWNSLEEAESWMQSFISNLEDNNDLPVVNE